MTEVDLVRRPNRTLYVDRSGLVLLSPRSGASLILVGHKYGGQAPQTLGSTKKERRGISAMLQGEIRPSFLVKR